MSWSQPTGDISVLQYERYDKIVYWDLPNYFAESEQHEIEIPHVVYSPIFNMTQSTSWRMTLILNGKCYTEGKGIGFFLWKTQVKLTPTPMHGYPSHVSDFVSLGLEKYVNKRIESGNSVNKYCEGYVDYYGRFGNWNFLSLDILASNKLKLSPNGILRFFCILHSEKRKHFPALNTIILTTEDYPDYSDWSCKGCKTKNSIYNETCIYCWFPKNFDFNPSTATIDNEGYASTTSDEEEICETLQTLFHIDAILSKEDLRKDKKQELEGIDRLVENLKSLLLDEQSSDVLLKVEDREFKAHKAILKVRSPVFASMFQPNTKESATGVVDIPDCSAPAFEVFLLYIYSANADAIASDNVFDLYYVADKYEINDLKSKCIEFMKNNLSVENFCGVMTLSLQHSETRLQNIATQFFCDNVKKIIKTVQWQKYMKEYTTYANELYIKAINA